MEGDEDNDGEHADLEQFSVDGLAIGKLGLGVVELAHHACDDYEEEGCGDVGELGGDLRAISLY